METSSALTRRRRGRGFARALLLSLATLFLAHFALAVESEPRDPTSELAPGWELLGTFKGSTSSRLLTEVRNLIFDFENSGDLYDDLGDLSIGLGVSGEDWKLDWDNSFNRRILPSHEAIEAGGRLSSGNVSSYLDFSRLGSRGRFDYDYVPDIVGESDLGARLESGFVLNRRRRRDPIRIGDRPLPEIIDEIQEADTFFERYPLERDTSLVRGGTIVVGGLADKISHWLGEKSADTEQGALFFELYADPMALALDLGVPIETTLFTGETPGVRVGDSVDHTSFLGVVPAQIGYRKYGLRASFQSYFRFMRETTLTRVSEKRVHVRVRNTLGRGIEVIPFKVRPELRVFGLFKIGYTIYEAKLGGNHGSSSEVDYLVDLAVPGAFDALRQLLGDGTAVSWRPLAEAAIRADGVRVLDQQLRLGSDRFAQQRLKLFSWMRYQGRALASTSQVERSGERFREVVRVRSRDYARGNKRRWSASSSITSQGNALTLDDDGEWVRDPEGRAAVSILTSLRNHRATDSEIRRQAGVLATILGLSETPRVLQEIAAYRSPEPSRVAWNLELSFDGATMRRALAANETETWRAVGELFLGPGGGESWGTEEARRAWRKQPREVRDADLEPLFASEWSGRKALRVAGKIVDHVGDLRRYTTEDCLRCLSRAYRKSKELVFLQALLVRLAGGVEDSGLGYHFEIFQEDMLAPVSVTNGVRHVFRRSIEAPDVEGREAWSVEAMGNREFQSADSRLRGGFLWLNENPASTDSECWILRLFSDLEIDPELRVRVDLRDASTAWADPDVVRARVPIGLSHEVVMTPFMTARYYYDVSLPSTQHFEEGNAYTLLVRVLNADGYPVTEEQQIRFEWPKGINERLPPVCRTPVTTGPPSGQLHASLASPAAPDAPEPTTPSR